MATTSLLDKTVSSVKWSALIEIISRTAQPIVFIILARLLTPEDFGVVATAMIVISFSQMFWDAGLSKALIQTREHPEKAANVVFWTNAVLGLLIYLILFLMAPWVAAFFKSPASNPVLRIMGIQILVVSLCSVQQALFVRDLDFKGLFWIRLLTAFFPGVFSIPLAFYGYGAWALVTGSIAGQLLNLYLLWRRSAWRPNLSFDLITARKLVHFAFWVQLESIGGWLLVWGDSLIVGRYLGIHELGVYRTASMLVTIIFGLILNPFLPVLYPVFSRLQENSTGLKKAFDRVNRVVFALALPMGFGLLLIGPETALLLFGAKWQGLGFVLAVLGLTHGIAWLVGLNPELYRAMGRPDLNTKILCFAVLYYLPAYFFSAQYGLKSFTITRLAVALVAVPIHVYLCTRILKVSSTYIWDEGKPMIISTLVMALCVAGLKWGFLPTITDINVLYTFCLLIVAGASVYLACLWLMDRCFILETRSLIKRASVT